MCLKKRKRFSPYVSWFLWFWKMYLPKSELLIYFLIYLTFLVYSIYEIFALRKGKFFIILYKNILHTVLLRRGWEGLHVKRRPYWLVDRSCFHDSRGQHVVPGMLRFPRGRLSPGLPWEGWFTERQHKLLVTPVRNSGGSQTPYWISLKFHWVLHSTSLELCVSNVIIRGLVSVHTLRTSWTRWHGREVSRSWVETINDFGCM